MRKGAILLALATVLLWGAEASAFKVQPPVRWEGDPDEFEAKRMSGGETTAVWLARQEDRRSAGERERTPAGAAAGPRAGGGVGRARVTVLVGGCSFLWGN